MKSVEAKLLDALEMFQYSYRFRSSLFVLYLHPGLELDPLLTDLKLLQSSHISVLMVCLDRPGLEAKIGKLTERGLRLCYLLCPGGPGLSEDQKVLARTALIQDITPVVALARPADTPDAELCREAAAYAVFFGAHKFFYLSPERGLLIDGTLQSHLGPKDVEVFLRRAAEINIDRNLIRLFRRISMENKLEIVILEGTTGGLFQEIFTHRGRGTLITHQYPNVVRRGRLRDVFEISRLLRPYIEDGTILPATEDRIAEEISSYFVYTVNDALVAASQLVDYGEAASLSKFCTLPRYQGKGRARRLAKRMIQTAARSGKRYVFALSISPRMWAFFEKLGFREVARETLPAAWQQNYDFSRPSRAFRLDLEQHTAGSEPGVLPSLNSS